MTTRLFSLREAAADLLDAARESKDGRSSVSLHQGEACVLRQTVTALVAGQRLAIEHPPEEGWVLVLFGRVTVVSGHEDVASEVRAGDLLQLPEGPQQLTADEASVVLLMVAKGDRPGHIRAA